MPDRKRTDDSTKNRRKALSKAIILLLLAFLVFIFATIAWFVMNRSNSASGMGVKVASDPYYIVPLNGSDSIYTGYQELISGDSSDGLMVWQMTQEANMDNFDANTDAGIRPGSFGKIGFYVKPNESYVNLDLTFRIAGYKYSETTDPQTGEITSQTMTEVTSDELKGYLAGHILLFENRTDTTDPVTGRTTYTYSDPILTNSDFNRVISNRQFLAADENTPVYIYWVWAETLSTLVDVRGPNPNIRTVPLCVDDPSDVDDSYDRIVNDILDNPGRYVYRYSQSSSAYSEDYGHLTPAIIAQKYETYGTQFDRADNEIGMYVDYVTLKMVSNIHEGT